MKVITRCVGAAVLGVLLAAVALRADVIEQVLVKVNGDIITKTDLETRQVNYLRQRNQQFKDDDELKKVIEDVTPQVILDAVDEMLLMQRGKELGFHLTDERFQEVLSNIKKENKMETEEQFQAALTQEGLTLADLRKSLERQMVINGVQQREVWGKISTTEAESQAYYDQHKNDFTAQPSIMLREILVEVPTTASGLNVAADEAGKAEAEQARARVLKGEDFAKVAGEASSAASKANGGLIGPVQMNELAQNVQDLLKTMKQGDVTSVFRTTRGYQLLKLESATTATVKTFEQARDEIADKVFESKRRGEFDRYVQKLRDEAIIEWKNPELKKAYDKQLAVKAGDAPKTNSSLD